MARKKKPSGGSQSSRPSPSVIHSSVPVKRRAEDAVQEQDENINRKEFRVSPGDEDICLRPASIDASAQSANLDGQGLVTRSPQSQEELQILAQTCDVNYTSVISSSKMQKKISWVLDHLSSTRESDDNARPSIIVLTARADQAGKLISIVEIAKREIRKGHGRWWQYTKLDGFLQLQKSNAIVPSSHLSTDAIESNAPLSVDSCDRGIPQEQERDSESEFEGMNRGLNQKNLHKQDAKVRKVPLLTIFVSQRPIKMLEVLYRGQASS